MTSAKLFDPPVTYRIHVTSFLLCDFGGPPLPIHCGRHISMPPKFVESNGGTTMTNGEEATDGAGGGGSGTTSHMNGNAGSSSFDAPRMPIIFMLGE